MSCPSIKDQCKAHFLEYRDLLYSGDTAGIKAKLMKDAELDPHDFLRTVNLQRSALIMVAENKDFTEEYDYLYKTFHNIIDNKDLYKYD